MSEDEILVQIDWDITIRSFDTEAHVAHRYGCDWISNHLEIVKVHPGHNRNVY